MNAESAKSEMPAPLSRADQSLAARSPMALGESHSLFHTRLRKLLRSWRGGLNAASVLQGILGLLAAVTIYALLDFFLALSGSVRITIGGLVLTLWLIWTGWQFVRHGRLSRRDMARRVDALLAHPRHPALTALELSESPASGRRAGTPLEDYLIRQSLDHANAALARVSTRDAFPRKLFRQRLTAFLVGITLLAIIAVACWPVASVLMARIATPWRDVPPYSPYKFVIEPDTPQVFYGEDAPVAVEISGAPVTSQVWFQTRTGPESAISRTACFQETEGRYAQRLEKVVQPVEFSFAIGKARSRWMPVDLLLQPKVALASVTLAPPAYARMTDKTFLVGEAPFAGLRGSRVRLAVTSNRPLLDGVIQVEPASLAEGASGNPPGVSAGIRSHSVEGVRTGPQTVTFEWTIEDEADLSVSIRDIRGTAIEEPFLIRQKLVPDEPPKVVISEPPPQLMATPSIQIPVNGRAEDDLGLGRVELVRAVVGYRDRMRDVTPPSLEKRFDYESSIDLASLGVQPGETLEFYFEASDRNPSMMGVAASEVARVQIISEEDYATMIRVKTTIEEFSERYRILNRALQELGKQLSQLDEAQKNGDSAAADEALANATHQAAQAAELFEALKNDFAAFDLEKTVISQAGETLQSIQDVQQKLEGAGGDASQLSSEDLAAMLREIGAQEKILREETQNAEEVVAVARLMEMAAAFNQLVEDQKDLTRRLQRFSPDSRIAAEDVPLIKAMGERQKKLRQALDAFQSELVKRADDLPPAYHDIAESAKAFAGAVGQSGAEGDMLQAARHADNEDGRNAYQFGALAHEKLANLLAEPQPGSGDFASMCQGGGMEFQPMTPSLKETLQQMLAAIRLRGASGMGDGQGQMPGFSFGSGVGGGGGTNEDGYAMAGFTALDIPVMGPSRMRLQSPNSNSGPQFGEDGDTPGRQEDSVATTNESDRLNVSAFSDLRGQADQFDRVPEKYREAVKRYFTPVDSSSTQGAPRP